MIDRVRVVLKGTVVVDARFETYAEPCSESVEKCFSVDGIINLVR